jgi:hypothetical protein
MLLQRVDVPEFYFPTPESGMHYMTILTYFICALISFKYMEKIGVPTIQRMIINFTLIFLSFYVPFEWVYITLHDIFHNIPVYGYPVIWTYGWWKLNDTFISYIQFITSSLVGIDGFVTIGGIYILNVIKNDLKEFNFEVEYKFDKVAKFLLFGFLFVMFLWVIIPLHSPNVQGFGTKYFPQTIYVEYGYYHEAGLELPENGDIYGIIKENWYRNDVIKVHNHLAKAFSVAFMFYTFTPRRKKRLYAYGTV